METYQNQLDQISNENGGGLSTRLTGRYTSVRHEKAKLSKHTAGEAAKIITQKTGEKLPAKKLVSNWKVLFGQEPEWHHAGFYKGNRGSTMGRTFFFNNSDIEDYLANLPELETKLSEIENEIKVKNETLVYGFFFKWAKDYGNKKKHKELIFYKGNGFTPQDFTELTEDEYNNFSYLKGKKYYGWDEPKKSKIISSLTMEERNYENRKAKRRAKYAEKKAEKLRLEAEKKAGIEKQNAIIEAKKRKKEFRKTANENGLIDMTDMDESTISATIEIDGQYIQEGAKIKENSLIGIEKSNAQAQSFSRLLERNQIYISDNRKFWSVFSLTKY